MTGAGFARHYGIKYTTFAHWIRMRKKARAADTRSGKFLLVTAEADTGSKGVLIDLPNGVSLTVRDAEQAALAGEVIRALQLGN